jgi:hypothetical protein
LIVGFLSAAAAFMETENASSKEKDAVQEKRVAWRLASGQGDLLYAAAIIAMILALLRALLHIRQHKPRRKFL